MCVFTDSAISPAVLQARDARKLIIQTANRQHLGAENGRFK